jgi:hypothetical protein
MKTNVEDTQTKTLLTIVPLYHLEQSSCSMDLRYAQTLHVVSR